MVDISWRLFPETYLDGGESGKGSEGQRDQLSSLVSESPLGSQLTRTYLYFFARTISTKFDTHCFNQVHFIAQYAHHYMPIEDM